MAFARGNRVVDLLGNLGIGEILDLYTNYNDDPKGEELAICKFGGNDDGEEPTVCDRSVNQISKDLSLASMSAGPVG